MSTPEDLIHCPICLEVYRSPRALPFLHTFCQECLQGFINTSMRGVQKAAGFECPQSPCNNPHDTWAEKFEMNYIIVSLIDQFKGKEKVPEDSHRQTDAVQTLQDHTKSSSEEVVEPLKPISQTVENEDNGPGGHRGGYRPQEPPRPHGGPPHHRHPPPWGPPGHQGLHGGPPHCRHPPPRGRPQGPPRPHGGPPHHRHSPPWGPPGPPGPHGGPPHHHPHPPPWGPPPN